MQILILNGPNLNLLGTREPGIYGNVAFDQYFSELKNKYSDITLRYFQSNHEGAIIDKLHEFGFSCDGIILNAGAFSHTSHAIADAISAIETPVIEVHISNTFAREAFRHTDVLSGKCKGLICGLGLEGYSLAIAYIRSLKS
ncbi:MAG: type II 3-dehydroquinate dehydratase [Chitinophagales bacterium]